MIFKFHLVTVLTLGILKLNLEAHYFFQYDKYWKKVSLLNSTLFSLKIPQINSSDILKQNGRLLETLVVLLSSEIRRIIFGSLICITLELLRVTQLIMCMKRGPLSPRLYYSRLTFTCLSRARILQIVYLQNNLSNNVI